MAKMTDEQKAAAKRLREAKKSRLAWEARQAAAAAREEATKAEREAAFAERVAIMQQRAEALRKAKARATRAARKHAPPSALALTRRRNAEARRAAALAARKAEEEAQAKAAERAALAAASVRKPNAEQALPQSGAVPRRHYSVTLHDRNGWWEVAVFMRRSRSFFVIPFYQTERPEAMEAHRAVIEEITTRLKMGMAAGKPRKPKAPALPSKQPRDTAKIRRIERQLEGV